MDNENLWEDIKNEIDNLDRIVSEMRELLNIIGDNPTFIEIRSAGSILHDFYSGIEKIFERIGLHIDKNIPKGDGWHKELLLQMAKPSLGRKEQIISKALLRKLKEYMRFRHLFRHIYGFELKWSRIKPLCINMETVLEELKNEIKKRRKLLS